MRLRICRRFIISLVLIAALPACGITFEDEFQPTELFDTISLDGERVVGEDLTITVGLSNGYDVPVKVGCYYETEAVKGDRQLQGFISRAKMIGETVLSPAPDGRPDRPDVPIQTLSFDFSVDQPGDYFVACVTPAASDNGLGIYFSVAGPRPDNAAAP